MRHWLQQESSRLLVVSALLLAQSGWRAVAGNGPFAGPSRRGDDDAPFGRGQVNGGVYGQRSVGGLTEKVEGCFDRFDSEYMVELGRANINNKRCQAICTDRGYALAATGLLDRCFCGNDYPSIFHRVETSLCNQPCNPDKATCFSFTCCGSIDGHLLTVSWSGEMDIMLQILRQLSHDYRFNNPTFRSQIEGTFHDRGVAMQVMPPPGGREVVVVEEEKSGGDEGAETSTKKWSRGQEQHNQPLYLAVGDGCPVGWKLFDRWCYKTKWAQATTYPAAVKLCQEEDAELVTVTSEAENAFVREQLGGCQGWLGLKQMKTTVFTEDDDGAPQSVLEPTPPPSMPMLNMGGDRIGTATNKFTTSQFLSLSARGMAAGIGRDEQHLGRRKEALLWMASRFEAWRKDQEEGEEDKEALPTDEDQVLIEAEDAFGPTLASKGNGRNHFDEYYPGVQRVQSINVGFKEDGAISSFQLTYHAADGSEVAGSLYGQSDASVMSTMRLEDGDEITGVVASFGQWRIQSLQFHLHLANGSDVVHGVAPLTTSRLGGLGWRQLEYQPVGTLVGVFGNVGPLGNLLSLGFYTGNSMSCTKMDGSGEWVRKPCRAKDQDKSQYVCEKAFLDAKRGCSREWVAWETSCYLRRRGHGMSWWDARTACQELGGHLVAINSPHENDFINRLMGGTEGFIGYYRKQLDQGRQWHWDSYWKIKERDVEESITAPYAIGKGGALRRRRRWSQYTSQSGGEQQHPAVHGGGATENDCFEMLDDGSWHLVPCGLSTAATIICERGSPNATCNECPWPGKWEPWGCTCYHREVGSGVKDVKKTWLQANQLCNAMGARLVTIRSAEENEWVREFAKGAFVFRTGHLPTYLALNNLHDSEDYQWQYYDNWRAAHQQQMASSQTAVQQQHQHNSTTAGDHAGSQPTNMASDKTWQQRQPPQPDKHYINWQPKRCTQMSRHGQWVRAPCEEQQASCFVCKKDRAAAFISLRPQYEEWDIEVIEQPQGDQLHRPPGCKCPDCFRAFLRHSLTGLYLAVDSQNLVYMTHARDPAWSAFVLVAHPESGAVVVVTPHGDAALRWGHGGGRGWVSGGGGDGVYHGVHCAPLADGWDIVPAPPMLGDHKMMFKGGKHGGSSSGHHNPHPLPIFEEDGLLMFRCSHTLSSMAWRYLRLSVVAQSRDLNEPGLRECSVAVYDTTPETLSYECHSRAPGPADDLVFLEQEALLFFDQSTYAQPRVPLPNGRVRCENGSPTETATCTFAYGQGLTLSRQFRVNWGYTISDVITHRVNAAVTESGVFHVLPRGQEMSSMRGGKEMDELDELKDTIKERIFKKKGGHHRHHHGRGDEGMRSIRPTPAPQTTDVTISATELAEFVNAFSVAYNNFYEILITKAYVETRNWQLSVPVAPHTTDTIQFWLSSENLYYRWRALFAARGGFTISTFGQPIGSHHSLGDLTYFRDLFFFIFGSYEFPSEAEIIITVNDIPGDGWPLPTPETSQGDRVGNVVRQV